MTSYLGKRIAAAKDAKLLSGSCSMPLAGCQSFVVIVVPFYAAGLLLSIGKKTAAAPRVSEGAVERDWKRARSLFVEAAIL
jgi:hypothetical protein